MNNIKSMFFCFSVNMRKQLGSPKFYMILGIAIMFHYYSFANVKIICEYLEMTVTPWVFPFFLGNPLFFFMYGGLPMMLYSEAPFLDAEAPFLMIRLGRKRWILGQLFYIYISSFLYTLFHVVMSIVMMIPYLNISMEWGDVLYILAQNWSIYAEAGVAMSFVPSIDIMKILTPLQAMGSAILMFWLGTVLIAMIMFCIKICTGGMLGLIINGVLVAFAYFAPYLGTLNYSYGIYYFSPILWSCISYLNWNYTGYVPTFGFALGVYLVAIILMSVISVKKICEKDVCWEAV